MDFVVGLPRCRSGRDTIWVIVDRLTKSAHFLPIRNSDSLDKLAQLYIVRPEKFQFMEKWQNRNFDYKIVISVKNSKFIL